MSFTYPFTIETDAEEAARLRSHGLDYWAELPVLNPVIDKGMILRITENPGPGTKADEKTGYEIIVAITKIRSSGSTLTTWERKNIRLHDRRYEAVVVGGNHPAYPVGGYDIILPEYKLRRAERIILN